MNLKFYMNKFCLLANINKIANGTIHHIVHSLYQGIPNHPIKIFNLI
jgi:hypothetical protein